MEPSIDVVVPVHDHYELTSGCLQHLSRQTVAHTPIVVDDGSTDGTPERLRSEWPRVTLVQLPSSVGFARACNQGVRAGTGEVVVLLNNDVECRPDFLEALAAALAEPGVGAVAALMLQPGGELIDSVGLAADVTLAAFPRLHGSPAARAREPRPTLAGPAGAAAAYRRSAWEQAGGLDETIAAYMEDFDLALRLRLAGWRCAAAPEARGIHLGSATYGHRSRRQRLLGGYSRGYLLRRYGVLRRRTALRAAATELLVVIGDLLLSRDLAALRGRVAGWRAAARRAETLRAPAAALDPDIGVCGSLALRRGVYGRRQGHRRGEGGCVEAPAG